MSEIKPWYLSRTIWASVVTILLAAAGCAGFAVEPNDHAQLTEALFQLATALAGAIAIFGRLRATRRIG
jgi:hypothetical protein